MSSSGPQSPTPGGKADDTGPDNLVTGARSNTSDDDDEVWDPAAEKHPRESSSKSQDKTTATAAPSSDWQAIWSAAHGAYYFYNTATKETTWINPLVPPSTYDAPETTTDTITASDATAPANPSSSLGDSNTSPPSQSAQQPSSTSSPSSFQPQPSTTITAPSLSSFPSPSSHPTLSTAVQLGGIDPELAFLDPSLAYTTGGPNKGINTTGPIPTFTAKFNARSGRFAGGDARDPNHVSEYERAKRMSQAYFDVDSWNKQVEEREQARKRAAEQGEDPNAKRKKPTKADLERFREQKKEKKMRKIAWLRE